MTPIHTLGELRASGYRVRSVKDEMRANLLSALARGEQVFTGIHGYERTVLPAIHNAILSKHDIILLGLRGQAKTRILRSLTALLDEHVPVIDGCEINDSPFEPTCKRCRRLSAEQGDDLRIGWLARGDRYREKLATPDVTVADLVGDIDPIKAANQRLTYADEEVIHYGIIPRTNRGIFAINELPDLAPRIQVALLNILEERDLQIRGFPVRIPMDIVLVFSANPEDYTSRGNIITPLKDRIDSQILTHYPQTIETARRITDQEAWLERDSAASIEVPPHVRDLVEQIAFSARESELVDQSSGVSARLTIAAMELLQSNLERRAAITGDRAVYPRLSDLSMVLPAITGKVEMVYEGEQQGAEVVARKLVGLALAKLFESKFPPVERAGVAQRAERERRGYGEMDADDLDDAFSGRRKRKEPQQREEQKPPAPSESAYDAILGWFAGGNQITLSDEQPFAEYFRALSSVPQLADVARKYTNASRNEELAWWMEMVLEGLHQALRLAREDLDSTITFHELMKFNVLRTVR
ncbi:MAG: AAA family ATPase [Acidobacteria bacterium]|nr:AAA family ATPase [Acidobacteriota bacterium]MBV9476075.1 AAA family ATPase [Acidobacteriota bacterium]